MTKVVRHTNVSNRAKSSARVRVNLYGMMGIFLASVNPLSRAKMMTTTNGMKKAVSTKTLKTIATRTIRKTAWI